MIKDERPNVSEYFSRIAKVVALRSTCLRHKFGCVVVDKFGQIVATGYNGAPSGIHHCLEIGCVKNKKNIKSGQGHEECRGVHSEMNALIQSGKLAENGTLYTTGYPCKICARLIINAKIKKVVVSGKYSDLDGLKLLKEAYIEVEEVTLEDKPCISR